MKKLIIFDLDGTLLNTIADLATATNQALEQFNFPTHSIETYRFMVGNGINKLFERALPEIYRTEEYIVKIKELFVPYYDLHNTDLTKPYEGIEELLATLQKHGMKLAVASNKYQAATSKLINKYFRNINFCDVFGQRDEIPSKPSPAVINTILRNAQLDKENVIYIGDSNVDMITGQNAGVTTIGVSWGFRPRTELEQFSPDFIADKPSDILEFIGIQEY